MKPSLNGGLILVTRPAAQAENLCQLIEQQQGIPVRFPTLEIQHVDVEPAAVARALQCDWMIFTSTNAVDFAVKAFGGKMNALHSVKIAAVGQATAGALRKAGFSVACVPTTEFSSEGLLAEPAMQAVSEKRVMIVRGMGGREKLAQTLRSRGAHVDYLEVYQRRQPEVDSSALINSLAEDRLRATTVTSAEALQNLLIMLGETSAARLRNLPLVVVSERIAMLAQQLGFKHIAVSEQPTDAAILQTLTTLLNGDNSGRSN